MAQIVRHGVIWVHYHHCIADAPEADGAGSLLCVHHMPPPFHDTLSMGRQVISTPQLALHLGRGGGMNARGRAA